MWLLGDDAGLGKCGLGRLAACHLDSMAHHEPPRLGLGRRYQYLSFLLFAVDRV